MLFAARTDYDDAGRTPEQQRDIEVSDAALEEFLAAGVVVIGAPMYNFTIPSQLKAWIDRLAVSPPAETSTDQARHENPWTSRSVISPRSSTRMAA